MRTPFFRTSRASALIRLVGVCWIVSALSVADAGPPSTTPEGVGIALVGGRIHTQEESGTIVGTILIRDGKVEALGPEIEVPDDAETIDISGLVVTPGLIDARSVLWLDPAASREGSNSGELNVLDGIDPYAEDWKDVAQQGVTAVSVQPAESGRFGGQGAILRVGPGGSIDNLLVKEGAFVQAALGLNSNLNNSFRRYAESENLKRTLESLKTYKEAWEKYRKALEEFEKKQEEFEKTKAEARDKEEKKEQEDVSDQEDEDEQEDVDQDKKDESKEAEEPKAPEPPKAPTVDPVKEFLVGVLEGKVPLRIEAHREDDLRNLFNLLEEFPEIRLIVEGLSDPRSLRNRLVNRRVPLVLGPLLELEGTPSYRRSRQDDWPASLIEDDSRWALGTYGREPSASRLLRAHAALAVARGIEPELVLRALTAGAAQVLGVGDRLGSITEGKDADIAVFQGDPLDPSTPVALVLSAGRIVYQADLEALAEEEGEPLADLKQLDLPDRMPRRYLIRTERLLNLDGQFEPGQFRVVDGKFSDIGPEISADEEDWVYDLGDAVVTPGLLSAYSDLGLGRRTVVAGANAGHVRAADAYDPEGQTIRTLVRGGVLTSALAPGSTNVIAGAPAALRLGAETPILEPELGLAFTLTSSARSAERYPASLGGQVTLVDRLLADDREETDLLLPDPVLERLSADSRRQVEALSGGQRLAFFEVAERSEIQSALTLIDRFALKGVLVLDHPEEISPFLDDCQRLDVAILARPVRDGQEARWLSDLARAGREGVRLAFAGDDPLAIRLTVALAVGQGLPRPLALQALTAGGAKMVGMPEGAGQMVEGGPADFVVWNGSPINLQSRPLQIITDGQCAPY